MNFDRVDSLDKFLSLKNKTVWLVTNPMFKDKAEIFGNSFISKWEVGDVYDITGEIVDDSKTNHFQLYSPHATMSKSLNDIEYKYFLPLHDYNVIEGVHTCYKNAVFYDEKTANEYRVWLMMQYRREELLDLVDKNTTYCLMLDWDNFVNNGINFEESLK